jgi:hypothetical protein
LIEAAAPGLPLVRSQWGYVVVTVNASLFERFGVRLGVAAETAAATSAVAADFAAAVADEHDLDLLLEAAMSVIFVGAMLPPLKMPMWENLSRLARVICRVCMPPMERPAMARWG